MKNRFLALLGFLQQKAWWETIILSLVAGLIVQWLQLPAAWLIGPMVAALLMALRGRAPASFPSPLLYAVQAVLGVALSATFQPAYLLDLAWNWFPVLGVILAVLLFCLMSGITLIWISQLSPATAILGTVPGAASGMIVMSDELGGDARVVAFMQYSRLIIVIILTTLISHLLLFLFPHPASTHAQLSIHTYTLHPLIEYTLTLLIAIGGSWLGLKLNIPAGALIGPMLIGIVVGLAGVHYGTWPPGVLQAGYLLLGINVGRRFDQASLKFIGRLAPLVLLQVLVLVVVCALCGIFLSWVAGTDLLSGYLATNPGGLDSVAVAALDTGANMSLVLATQLLRFFTIVLAGPPVVRWLTRRVQERTNRNSLG